MLPRLPAGRGKGGKGGKGRGGAFGQQGYTGGGAGGGGQGDCMQKQHRCEGTASRASACTPNMLWLDAPRRGEDRKGKAKKRGQKKVHSWGLPDRV